MEIIFATNNKHKLQEIRNILPNKFKIKSLEEINFTGEIPETNPTIKQNAAQKAHFIYQKYKINCFADDTGLEIPSLHNQPGVYSARYAGENASYQDNVLKVLQNMQNKTNRNAQFITVICLIFNDKEYFFEAIIKGKITHYPRGEKGFGYDPIFVPEGYEKTYAQISPEEKNTISHRALATQKLTKFLLTRKS